MTNQILSLLGIKHHTQLGHPNVRLAIQCRKMLGTAAAAEAAYTSPTPGNLLSTPGMSGTMLWSILTMMIVFGVMPKLQAQIDPRSVTPDSAGDKPGLSGKAYCDGLFKPVSIEVLENYTNGQVYERENELINCAITYINQEPKNDEEGYQALLQIREVNNANNILLARMKQFINQKGLTHEFLFPPKK